MSLISNISTDKDFIRTAIAKDTMLYQVLSNPANHHLLPRGGTCTRCGDGVLRVFTPRDKTLSETQDIALIDRELLAMAF